MKSFILVAKIKKENEIALKQFEDFLKEENIEYKEKLEEEWVGIRQPKYVANIALYVREDDVARVNKMIQNLEDAIILTEDYTELKEEKEEKQNEDAELKKYEKRQKLLQRIMIYGIFTIVGVCIILTIISNLN